MSMLGKDCVVELVSVYKELVHTKTYVITVVYVRNVS